MKNKKKKGFTLIELLAIIVILAIIAVITVPIILNVIDNAKKGAAKDSAYGYKDAVNKYYVSELYENLGFNLDGSYTITDKGRLSNETGVHEIPFTGTTPTGGYLIYQNNILTSGCITMDEYKVIVSDGELTTVEKGTCGETVNRRFLTVVNQLEEGKIQTGDELAIDTEHFYVINSDENETVLLTKYNLNVGNNTQPEEYGRLGIQNSLAIGVNSDNSTTDLNGAYPATVVFSQTNYWAGQVGENLKYSGDIAQYGWYGPNFPYVYDNNSNLYNHIELYKKELEKLGVNINEARLLTYDEAIKFDVNNHSKLFETSFWFGSASQETRIWGTHKSANQILSNFYEGYEDGICLCGGVRPVIVVNTSDIEI